MVVARPDDTPSSVLSCLEQSEANGAYVLESGSNRVLGVAHDHLLAGLVRDGALDITAAVTPDFEAVNGDRPLVELCRRVGQYAVPLAVTDDEDRLLGVLPRAALLAALADGAVSTSANLEATYA